MPILLLILSLSLTFVSCASQAPDSKADTKLGLVQDEEQDEASRATEELRKTQEYERKKELERQITDPQTR